MRRCLFLPILWVALAPVCAEERDPLPPAPQGDTAALEKRVADLERQLASLQEELQEVRRQLQAQTTPAVAALTPQEAVKSFQEDPKALVTVEFGVEAAGWPDGPIPIDEDPMPPIMADWDGRLLDGGKFTLILTANAIRGLEDVGIELPPALPVGLVDLERLSVLSKHLKGKGVRVTGIVKASRPDTKTSDYYIVADDPAHFQINR
jgi:hypothetical protein